AIARRHARSTPSSRGRTSSSPPKPAKSSSTTRRSCSPTATVGSARSRRIWNWTRPTDKGRARDLGPFGGFHHRGRKGFSGVTLQSVAFYLLAFFSVASAASVVFAKNPVHSVLFLIATFFSAAGLFVLLGAEFLAMLLV